MYQSVRKIQSSITFFRHSFGSPISHLDSFGSLFPLSVKGSLFYLAVFFWQCLNGSLSHTEDPPFLYVLVLLACSGTCSSLPPLLRVVAVQVAVVRRDWEKDRGEKG